MAVSQYYVLNMSPGGVPLTIHVSQYDANSRTLVFTLYNNDEEFTVPSGSTVTARFTKASGNASTENCTFTGNVVSYVVSDQLTLYPGKVSTELRITNGTEVLGSANFYVVVEPATIDADTAISEDDLPTLEALTQTVDEINSNVTALSARKYVGYVSGDTVSITDGADAPVISLKANITGTQSGSGTISLNNPWPITAYENAVIIRSTAKTKNLLSLTGRKVINDATSGENWFISDGCLYLGATMNHYLSRYSISSYSVSDDSITVTTTASGYGVGFVVKVEAETEYTFSYDNHSAGNIGFGFYKENGEYISHKATNNLSDFTFTTPANCEYVMIVFRPSANVATTYNHPQLELGASATDYVSPASISTYMADVSPTKLFAYKGTIDATAGKAYITHAMVNMGNFTWSLATDNTYDTFYVDPSSLPAIPEIRRSVTCISSAFNAVENQSLSDFANDADYDYCVCFTSSGSTGRLLCRCPDYTTVSDFKSAVTGQYVAYELRTPLLIDVMSADIDTVSESQTITANCGDVSVIYVAEESA